MRVRINFPLVKEPPPRKSAVKRSMTCARFFRLALRAAAACLFLPLVGCTYGYYEHTQHSPDWKYAATCYLQGAKGRSLGANTKKMLVVSINSLAPDVQERIKREEKWLEAQTNGFNVTDHMPGALVTSNDPLLFRKTYWVKGSDVEWAVEWRKDDEVSLSFYDCGAGAEVPYELRQTAPQGPL